MQRTKLGKSGLNVPVFAVGTGGMGSMAQDDVVRILRRAWELGAVWWDTSDDYGSQPFVGTAMRDFPRDQLTISTKTHARTHGEGVAAVHDALRELGGNYLDIMFLHDVRDLEDLNSRRECLRAFSELKQQGIIRAIGLSSHFIAPFIQAAREPDIDVVLAPWNARGLLPEGGALTEMKQVIHACYKAGKGVVLMKVLASGQLKPFLDEAIHAAAHYPEKHVLNIGVSSVLELETDIRLALGEPVDSGILRYLKTGHVDGREAA